MDVEGLLVVREFGGDVAVLDAVIGQRLRRVGVGGVTGPVRDVGGGRPRECAVHTSWVCGICDTGFCLLIRIM